MEQPAPDWLSLEYLTQCLQSDDSYKDVVVTQFTTSKAVPLGEQFLSCPLRVKVQYRHKDSDQSQSLSLIIKSEIKEGHTKEMISSFECTESLFYREFIPKAKSYIDTGFIAKSFHSPNPSIIILEDLKDKGFVMGDKVKRLDYEHCRIYINAITALHAVSVAVHKEDPKIVEAFRREKVYSNDLPMSNSFKVMGSSALRCLAEFTETSDRFKKHTKLLRDLIPNLWDLVVETVGSMDGLKTLNHGDSWTNNLMFKYNKEGSVKEIKILDFQVVRYNSPLIDLVYFIWSSASDEVRRHRIDDIYHLFVDQLNLNLQRVDCDDRVSYEFVKREVQKLSPLVLSMVTGFAPFNSENSVEDIEQFLVAGSEENTYKTYKSFFSRESYSNDFLPKLMDQLEVSGTLECLERCVPAP